MAGMIRIGVVLAVAAMATGCSSIVGQTVLAVHFDEADQVVDVERSGMELVARIDPENDETPTLGRNRSFFEDLFGNIGQVGAGAPVSGGGGGG